MVDSYIIVDYCIITERQSCILLCDRMRANTRRLQITDMDMSMLSPPLGFMLPQATLSHHCTGVSESQNNHLKEIHRL